MPVFDAILFDFDGVLLDSEPLHYACWAEVLAPFGVNLAWEVYCERYIGIDDRDMLRLIAAAVQPPLDWEVLFAQYPKKKALFERRIEDPPFLPSLHGLLRALQTRYKLAVVSSSARSEIEPPLVAGRLRDFFDVVVAGGDAAKHKPAPDPYLLAARRLGAACPLVVEDSPAGIASGRAAGFEVLPVESAARMPELLLNHLSSRLAPG
jgi:HAD superfamily hydrolase (TIGR01509 family)